MYRESRDYRWRRLRETIHSRVTEGLGQCISIEGRHFELFIKSIYVSIVSVNFSQHCASTAKQLLRRPVFLTVLF
jgi:hypothetical protein